MTHLMSTVYYQAINDAINADKAIFNANSYPICKQEYFFYYLAIYDAVIAILFELFRYISKHTKVYKTSLAVKMQIKICNL